MSHSVSFDSDCISQVPQTLDGMSFKALFQSSPPPPSTSTMTNSEIVQPSNSASTQNIGTIDEEASFPTVTLNSESISDIMAARLAMCLLGHVLYLKSQVPFPVAQLYKMSPPKDQRSAKRHDSLLSAFDLLSTHLSTTFTALSTAFAQTKEFESKKGKERDNVTTHMAFILGPTITNSSAARARVLLEINGLEVKIFGERVDKEDSQSSCGPESDDEDQEEFDDSDCEGYFEDAEIDSVPDSSSEVSGDETQSSWDSSDEDEDEEDIEEPITHEENLPSDLEIELRRAERLLSRALAIANSDVERGMAAEISATQTHILLRAPRLFAHPAWIPRQNIVRDMDKLLSGLNTTDGQSNTTQHRSSSRKTAKVDYIRILCEDDRTFVPEQNDGLSQHDPEEELIWWSWDGKLEGFSDW